MRTDPEMPNDAAIRACAEHIDAARSIAVLTGAGVSAESVSRPSAMP